MAAEPGQQAREQEDDTDYDRAALLAEQILAGKFDDGLPLIITAINSRMATRGKQRQREAMERLMVHSRVRIGKTAKPQYLRGLTGEVHEIHADFVVVCLDKPVGRFTYGHIRCPPQRLQPIDEG